MTLDAASAERNSAGGELEQIPVTLDEWIQAADLHSGKVFRCVCGARTWWGDDVTERLVWHVVKLYAAKTGFAGLAPHDLTAPRSTLARDDSKGRMMTLHHTETVPQTCRIILQTANDGRVSPSFLGRS